MPIVRLPGGSLRDEIRQPLYDTLDILAGVSPVGDREFYSNVQGKDKSLSNLRQNNLLETAVSFRCQGLGFDAQNNQEANKKALALIMESSALTLRVGEKIYWESNATLVAGRMRSAFAVSVPAAGPGIEDVYQAFGEAAVQAVVLSGKHVVDINPLQSFRVLWSVSGMTAAEIALATPAANTKLRFIQSLKGLIRRPVQ